MSTEVESQGTPGPTSCVVLPPCADALEGASRLALALAKHRGARTNPTGFLRIEQPLHTGDPLTWLADRPNARRLYFETADASFALAGIGVAATWRDGLGAARTLFARLAADEASAPLRFLLTHRFAGAVDSDSPWAAFGGTRLVLPLLELRRTQAGVTLAVQLDEDDPAADTRAAEALAHLARQATPRPLAYRAVMVADEPGAEQWTQAVEATLADIVAGQLTKCVLARTRTYAIDGVLDPFALLDHARGEQPDTFRFGIQVRDDLAFLGTTPEVLFRRNGAGVESEALAGTRARGRHTEEDDRLAAELMDSPKDRDEHELVRQHIESVLAPLCTGPIDIQGPALRKLAGIQHLDTRLAGRLKDQASDIDLLEGLHPTPAVCGVPKAAAEAAIEAREPFDRGLYAGAIGLIGRDEATITVGIRSALLQGDRITLLAGAGIVKGSVAQAEWQETSDKMRVMDAILRAGRAP